LIGIAGVFGLEVPGKLGDLQVAFLQAAHDKRIAAHRERIGGRVLDRLIPGVAIGPREGVPNRGERPEMWKQEAIVVLDRLAIAVLKSLVVHALHPPVARPGYSRGDRYCSAAAAPPVGPSR